MSKLLDILPSEKTNSVNYVSRCVYVLVLVRPPFLNLYDDLHKEGNTLSTRDSVRFVLF